MLRLVLCAPTIADDPATPTVDRMGRAKPLSFIAAILMAMTYRNSSAPATARRNLGAA